MSIPVLRTKQITCWISLMQCWASQYQPALSLFSTVPRHIGLVTTNKYTGYLYSKKVQLNKKLNTCLLSDATLPKMQYVCFCFQIGGNCATESNASDIFEPRSKTFSAQHDFFHNIKNCIVSLNLSQTMMDVGCMYAPVDAHLIVVWEYTLLHRINRAQEWPDCHFCQ